jgi:chemotaxis protein methyltransferase CheR
MKKSSKRLVSMCLTRKGTKPVNDNVVVNKDNTDFNFPVSLQEDYINFIHERVGLIVKKNQKEFIKSVNQACQYFELNPYQYFDKLQQSADNSPLLGKLVSAITIDETYFFRDKNQIKLLIETILPSIINSSIQNNKKSLRVWSAGCSSGEEIYTLAMLIKELYPSIDSWTITLLATDINIDSLKKGINGKFSEWSMRSIPKKYLSKYFIKTDKVYALSEDIKKMVTFDYLNLVDDNYPSILNGTTLQDLILCRNVMIYFDNAHIKTIIERLANCVADDGYVMLGASDPIAMMGANVEIVPGVPSLFRKRPLSKAEISVPDAMPCEMLSHSKLLTASLEVNSIQVAKSRSSS